MCGIYGILHLDGSPVSTAALRPMGELTIHRGPDDEGMHADGPLAFGMRRLAIIDVTGARVASWLAHLTLGEAAPAACAANAAAITAGCATPPPND